MEDIKNMKKKKINRLARTKIIATLGPASSDISTIRNMVASGMNVARVNFSHGTQEDHLEKIKAIRKINEKYRRSVKTLGDLEGYRIRIREFSGSGARQLNKRAKVSISNAPDNGDPSVIPLDYGGDLKKIGPGRLIYIDDGNIILRVTHASSGRLSAVVVEGGRLLPRKGVNIPGVRIPFPGVTEKDLRDLEFCVKHRVDHIAQSFVRTPGDIKKIKEHITPLAPRCRIIAKIESREAIGNIDGIIEASDGIMIARGDMGIAVPIYTIPVIQKMIIKKCNRQKKPVITATQMLEHMTRHSRPTRAEVTDVANAILDGTDFVMLSAESAAGDFPVESVKMMDRIIKFTETHERYITKRSSPQTKP